MSEPNYMDMANKISNMLNEKISYDQSVDEVLTDLIKMDNVGQDGGVLLDKIVDNLTGGGVNNDMPSIPQIQPKEINENYFEGGGVKTGEDKEETEEESGEDKKNTGEDKEETEEESGEDKKETEEESGEDKKETEKESGEDKKETEKESGEDKKNTEEDKKEETEEDEEESSSSDYEEDENETNEIKLNLYEEFLKHYEDKEPDISPAYDDNIYDSLFGGSSSSGNETKTKIKIITRFPYMIRY